VCVIQQVVAPLGPARCPTSFSRHTTDQQSRDIHSRRSAVLFCFICLTERTWRICVGPDRSLECVAGEGRLQIPIYTKEKDIVCPYLLLWYYI